MLFNKKSFFVLVLLVGVGMSGNLQAGNPIEKLGRGCAGIIFSPMELLMRPVDVAAESGNIAGVTYGLFSGIAFTIARIGVGVADVVTFLTPLPGCADNPYDTGWGYGPMAFRDSPWVVDAEHNWAGFFYDTGSMVTDEF